MNKLASALHDATHQVPGVPPHHENQPNRQPASRRTNTRQRLQSAGGHPRATQRHQKPPRVFVAWQNWIGEHIGRRRR
jgi:hypothetical protein